MVVSPVIAPEASQVLFIQRNDMIQHLAPATGDPALGYAVLTPTAHARANGLETTGLKEPGYIAAKLRRSNTTGSDREGARLPELLDDPTAGRICRGIEMQNSPPIMLDYKEAINHAEVMVEP
jgi:hypothetical protein